MCVAIKHNRWHIKCDVGQSNLTTRAEVVLEDEFKVLAQEVSITYV